MKKECIDRDKLRGDIRKLCRDDLLTLLDRAIEHLPKTRLPEVFKGSIDSEKLKNSRNTLKELLPEIKRFHKTSLRGEYYEGFNVNSKNYMKQSAGTKKWIRECNRLLNLCVSEAQYSCVSAREGMSVLFELLRRIDEGYDDMVFFADEAGSWQVDVDWDKVLPTWFRCLSETAEPNEFTKEAVKIIEYFVEYDREKFLAVAHKKAKPEQRKALPEK